MRHVDGGDIEWWARNNVLLAPRMSRLCPQLSKALQAWFGVMHSTHLPYLTGMHTLHIL